MLSAQELDVLSYVYTIPYSFLCRHETLSDTVKTTTTTTTARDWNKSFTHIEHRTGTVGQEGFVNLTFQSLLLNSFFRVSWFRSSPLLIHVSGPLYYSPTTCSHYTNVWHRTYLCDAPLSRPALRSFAPLQKCAEIIVLMCERKHGF